LPKGYARQNSLPLRQNGNMQQGLGWTVAVGYCALCPGDMNEHPDHRNDERIAE
jgi:hypothetical protein